MDPTLTNQMNETEKFWFAQAITAMIYVDGRVEESEVEYLQDALKFLDDRYAIQKIIQRSVKGTPPDFIWIWIRCDLRSF